MSRARKERKMFGSFATRTNRIYKSLQSFHSLRYVLAGVVLRAKGIGRTSPAFAPEPSPTPVTIVSAGAASSLHGPSVRASRRSVGRYFRHIELTLCAGGAVRPFGLRFAFCPRPVVCSYLHSATVNLLPIRYAGPAMSCARGHLFFTPQSDLNFRLARYARMYSARSRFALPVPGWLRVTMGPGVTIGVTTLGRPGLMIRL